MEQCLECGIAQKITIENMYKEDNKAILERIGEDINLDLYDVNKNPQCIELEMKKEIVEKYLVDFIIEQLNLFWKYEIMEKEEGINKLKELKYEELIFIAKEDFNSIFTYLRNCIKKSSNSPIKTSVVITVYR